jgi:hypothetical protein
MFMVIYTILWLLSALALLLFGFLTGRFARKLPVIDDALPWTLHWGEILPVSAHAEEEPTHLVGPSTWPRTGGE